LKLPSIRTLRKYHRIAGVGEIARRYFALNAFDGVLVIMGVMMGSYFGGVREAASVITLGFSASFALGLSGFYSAYMSERAERKRALAELEQSTLGSLEDTEINRASAYATIVVAVVNGASPFGAAVLALIPFFLSGAIGIEGSFYAGFLVAFAELFGLGMFLGSVSRERMITSGLKMITAGIILLSVGYLLDTV
jgi:predicted membrane protein (TIGR00267 family)